MMKSGRIKKIFENWSEIKIIWKETRVLKIKFEDWNFERLF